MGVIQGLGPDGLNCFLRSVYVGGGGAILGHGVQLLQYGGLTGYLTFICLFFRGWLVLMLDGMGFPCNIMSISCPTFG